jgi:DNA-binding beta-propeller fold protein YncE
MNDMHDLQEQMALPTMALPSYVAGVKRRKMILMVVLLIALLLTAVSFARYYLNKETPLPTIDVVEKGKVIPPNFSYSFNGGDNSEHALSKPQGVAVHPQTDNIYVTSFVKNLIKGKVEVFSPDGSYLFTFDKISPATEKKPQTLRAPTYIAINKKGNVYVSDKTLHSIFIFGRDGKFISKFLPDGNPDFKWAPTGMAFDDDGNLYVTDLLKDHRVLVFDSDGKLKKKFGATFMVNKNNEAPGKFYFPNGVFVDRDNRIFVADSNNRRVQVFSPQGKFLYLIPTGGLPRGIAIDKSNRLYVVDGLGHNITVYKKTAKKDRSIATFGSQGRQFGQFMYPNGLALNESGSRVFVTDRENHRVQVWVWPTVAAAVTPAVKKNLPIGLLLAALIALLLWRLFRRRQYFASAKFISEIVADHQLYNLKKIAKRVYVHPATYERFKKYSEGDVEGEDVLRPLSVDEMQVESFKINENLDDESALLFAGAGKGWIKPRILTNDVQSHRVAHKLNLESMDYRLFINYFAPESQKMV